MSNLNAILEDRANGVIYNGKFYPYRLLLLNPTVATNTYSPKLGCRYYVKNAIVAIRTVAGDTSTMVYAQMTQNNIATNYFTTEIIPSVAQVINIQYDIRLLFDRDSNIVAYAGVADPTHARIYLIIAEVDDL
jgi:hypothetical protein